MKNIFFNKSKDLENKIDIYLDTVNESVLIFKRDLSRYIDGQIDIFEEEKEEINEVENKADELQNEIKHNLYEYMLIPESRGDVLTLLERVDNIVDHVKKIIHQISIEKPYIPENIKSDCSELIELVTNSVNSLVKCIRSYFKNLTMVDDYVNKVHFYEHEADKVEERIKRKVFNNYEFKEFSKKVHLRYFTEKIAVLADESETISELASVAAIKRRI
ncbi:MAG: DUF47 family protein [Halanaerobiales bacterium]|nr:DUF47 family protein [Halanaerobiales bacterium]